MSEDLNIRASVEAIETSLHIASPMVHAVFDHWADLAKSANALPDRRAIDPEVIAPALANVWLCDFLRPDRTFQYRLVGEDVRSSHEQSLRGKYLHDITESDVYPRVISYFRQCVEQPAVIHIVGRIYAENARVAGGERILMPFSDNSSAPAGIIGATVRNWADQSDRPDAPINTKTRRHSVFPLTGEPPSVEIIEVA